MTDIAHVTETDVDNLSIDMERPKRRLWLRLSIIGVLVLVLAAGSWLTASALLGKSPKEQFLTAEWHAISSSSEAQGKKLDEELSKALADKPFEYMLKLNAGMSADMVQEHEFEEVEAISAMLEAITLQLSGQRSAEDGWIDVKAELLQHDDPILDLSISADSEQISLSSEELLDDTYYVKKEDLSEWITAWDAIEKQLESQGQLQDIFQLSDEQLTEIRARYGKFLYDHLKDEYFTVEEGISISTPEGTIRGKRITLALGDEELQQLIIALIDQLRADQALQQLLVDRLYMIMTINPDMEYIFEELDQEYLAEIIEDGLYELKQVVSELRSVGELEIEAYVSSGNKLIERHIVYEAKLGGADIELEVESSNWKTKDGKLTGEMKLTLEVDESGLGVSVIELEGSHEIFHEKDAIKRDLEYELTIQDEVGTSMKAELELDMTEATVNNGEDRIIFLLRMDGLDDETYLGKPEINGDIRIQRDQDLKKDRAVRKGEYKLEVSGITDGKRETMSIEFGLEFEANFDDDLKREKADRAGVNLFDMSEEELEALGEQIGIRLLELLTEVVE